MKKQTIMLTGYWPPTNEMVRRFSQNPSRNPEGWQGENWRGRGFDVVSFFPEFPDGVLEAGVGELTVDYEATSKDWWRITEAVRPRGLITFSRGFPDNSWEVESQQRNLTEWKPDFRERQPDPAPPDESVPAETIRNSTLPMEEIVARVEAADLGLKPYIDREDFGGAFLSEFIAYHGVWYQSLHESPDDPHPCLAAGHIHVGQEVTVEQGIAAMEISLEALMDHIGAIA